MGKKLGSIEKLVHPFYVSSWIGTANFVAGTMALLGGIGVAIGVTLLAMAIVERPGPGRINTAPLSVFGATYFLAAALSTLALGSIVANVAACRKHLQELVALRIKEQGLEVDFTPVSDDE
jgi:hypothetical protein